MALALDLKSAPVMNQLLLKKCQYEAREFLGAFALDQMRLEHRLDHMMNGFVFSLRTAILESEREEHRTEDKQEVSVPSSWWQHFKRDNDLPKWFLKRWPVKYRKITTYVVNVTRKVHMCPHVNHVPQRDHFNFLWQVKEEPYGNKS